MTTHFGAYSRRVQDRCVLGTHSMPGPSPRKRPRCEAADGKKSFAQERKSHRISSNSSMDARRPSAISAAITSGSSRLAESARLSSLSQKMPRLSLSLCASCSSPYGRHQSWGLDPDQVGLLSWRLAGWLHGTKSSRSSRLSGQLFAPQRGQAVRTSDLSNARENRLPGPTPRSPGPTPRGRLVDSANTWPDRRSATYVIKRIRRL
jgi:hypothetical protein